MERPTQPVYARLHVWGFTVASAVAAAAVCILALPLHMWKHQRMGYGVVPGNATGYPGAVMMHHGGFGLWPLWLLIMIALWAGIGGAIFAAVYNAMVRQRP